MTEDEDWDADFDSDVKEKPALPKLSLVCICVFYNQYLIYFIAKAFFKAITNTRR
jgi:hypothetical protein